MKNAKRMLLGLVLLGCALICTACGTKKIPDETLKAAIQSWDSSYSDYGLTMKSFDVQSRNYDKKYKTESVTVAVTAENEDSVCKLSYEVVGEYGDKGQYGDKHWNIVEVAINANEISPKNPLPESRVEELAGELLKRVENIHSLLSETEYSYDHSVQPTVPVTITLKSNVPFMETVCTYHVTFTYTLSGWACDDANQEGERTNRLTDDLCGTWSYVNEDGVSYGVVIDKVDGMTASIKCHTSTNKVGWDDGAIRQLSSSTVEMPMEVLYESYRAEGTIGKTTVRWNDYGRNVSSDYLVTLTIYPANRSSFSWTRIHGDFIQKGVCIVLGIYTDGSYRDFKVGYLLTKQ